MQKSQVLLVGAAVALLVILFAFGRTVPRSEKKTYVICRPYAGWTGCGTYCLL
jgi:hypothetical protein